MRPNIGFVLALNASAFGAWLMRVARQPTVPFIAVSSLIIGIIFGLFVATPTLNLDDLGYAENWDMSVNDPRFFPTALRLFTNVDLAVTQVRTYGLSRAIHLLQMVFLGATPVATYAFIATLHFASACIVFALTRAIIDDRVTALFTAMAWAASPAALLLFKSEHHFLYSLAPFYPLLLWMVLANNSKSGWMWHIGGTLLLVSACLMGEAVILPLGASVALMAWIQRDWRLLAQGACALGVVGLYLLNQTLFINDPSLPQRITLVAPDPTRIVQSFGEIGENARGVLTYSFQNAELAARVGGVNAFKTPLTWVAFVAAFVAALNAVRDPARPLYKRGRPELGLVLVATWLLSPALHIVTAVFSILPIAPRYSAAFYLLAPVALIGAFAAYSTYRESRGSLNATRTVAGATAAFALALSLGGLYRMEVLVNQPTREFIAELSPGSAVVAQHQGWDPFAGGNFVSGTYPGLMSTMAYEAASPFRSAWTADLYLRHFRHVTFGTSCRFEADGQIAVYHGREKRGVFPAESVKAGGLPAFGRTMFEWRPLAEVCTTPGE